MAKKGNLFLLIKSLTKSEKRYFRLYATGGKANTNYLQLFDALDKQEQPDDDAIRERFKDHAFINQLHVTKIYLADLILKSLRNYYTSDSVHSQLLDLMRDIEILYRKELYDTCMLKVEKAEKLAERYEKSALLTEVLGWKRKLMITQAMSDQKKTNALLTNEKTAIDKLHDLNHYWQIILNMFEAAQKRTFLKDLEIHKTSSLQALTLQKHLLYSYYFMNGRVDKAESEISNLISYLEKHPERIADDPGSYVTAVSNKIGLLLGQKRWDEIDLLIRTMREVPSKYKLAGDNKFTVRLWLRIFNLELEVCRDRKELTRGIILIREVEGFMKAHKAAIPDHYKIMLCYQIAGICFLNNNFSRSLHWINEIVNSNFGETRNELQCYARIMNLMIHFELSNILVLRYAVESCRRFFKKKKNMHSFEQQVLLLFSRLSLAPSKDYKVIFQKSYHDIYTMNISQKEKIQDYIDLKGWMETKMRGKRG